MVLLICATIHTDLMATLSSILRLLLSPSFIPILFTDSHKQPTAEQAKCFAACRHPTKTMALCSVGKRYRMTTQNPLRSRTSYFCCSPGQPHPCKLVFLVHTPQGPQPTSSHDLYMKLCITYCFLDYKEVFGDPTWGFSSTTPYTAFQSMKFTSKPYVLGLNQDFIAPLSFLINYQNWLQARVMCFNTTWLTHQKGYKDFSLKQIFLIGPWSFFSLHDMSQKNVQSV